MVPAAIVIHVADPPSAHVAQQRASVVQPLPTVPQAQVANLHLESANQRRYQAKTDPAAMERPVLDRYSENVVQQLVSAVRLQRTAPQEMLVNLHLASASILVQL
jgi:hypothetical protein